MEIFYLADEFFKEFQIRVGKKGYHGKYFKLIADINLDVAPYNLEKGWIPIGNGYSGNFIGVLTETSTR